MATIAAAPGKFSDCVHCGLCLTACPTYLELGTEADSPRGRIYLMEHLAAGEVTLDDDVVRHLDLCLGCRACESACPSGVRYGELIEAARIRTARDFRRPWLERLRRRMIAAVFPHPEVLRLLLLPLRALEWLGALGHVRRWSATVAMLPPLTNSPPVERAAPPAAQKTATLFEGCVNRVLFASVNDATRVVLRSTGFAVNECAGEVCCGALHLHAGDLAHARELARRNVTAFAGAELVLVNAAGCGAMLKEYGHLLRDDPQLAAAAAAFAAKVQDVNELLAAAELPVTSHPRLRVAYHDACHLAHAQGIRAQPRQLLRQIRGLELVELEESEVCCGSAGSYNLTEPEMAQRLGDRKAANIRASGAQCVAVANPGCAMQIRAALARTGYRAEVLHPIELLARAHRR